MPVNGQSSPGTTVSMTSDENVTDYCGVEIDSPGVWWWINGTGEVVRASTCDERTTIKVKISVFTGSCGELRCVTGGQLPDYECDQLNRLADGEWGSLSTAIDFDTVLGQSYYLLVQETNASGSIWLNFIHPNLPQNNHCIDSIGPIPRDLTRIAGDTTDAAVSEVDVGYCGSPALYPGVWYQFFGTGGEVTLMACSQYNLDGFYISVYNGGTCGDMSCVEGSYETDVMDAERCSFGAAQVVRPMTKYRVQTRDRDRYFVYVHYARTTVDKPTSEFHFWVDDGANGTAGTGGVSAIKFEKSTQTGGNGDDEDSKSGTWTRSTGIVSLLAVFTGLTCLLL